MVFGLLKKNSVQKDTIEEKINFHEKERVVKPNK